MPNPNYLRGRRYEYEVKKRWSDPPYQALRTAGSHGQFDIIAYTIPDGAETVSHREVRRGYEYISYVTPIRGYGIQCKTRKLRGKKVKG